MNTRKRYIRTDKEITDIVKSEVAKMYPKISQDVAYQTFAMVFMVLNRDYGFGKKRLHDLKDAIETEYWKMQAKPLGIEYDSDDVLRICKERFGIDFSESLYGGKG